MSTRINIKLIQAFLDKNILTHHTPIKAVVPIKDIGGLYTSTSEREVLFKKVIEEKGETFFIVSNNEYEKPYRIPINCVLEIDGMEPERLARSFGLREDGTQKIIKLDPITGNELRRGRKPKWVLEKMKELEQ